VVSHAAESERTAKRITVDRTEEDTIDLAEYYRGAFRGDLEKVVRHAPPKHEHERGEITIQPRTLSTENRVVRLWDPEWRGLFASALFLTVLVDQVCYSYFRAHYEAFRKLTRYPKFRGDCPGGCGHHIDPAGVFSALGKAPGSWPRDNGLDCKLLPPDLFETIRAEVHSFFPRHLDGIDPNEFWEKCDASVPVVSGCCTWALEAGPAIN